MRSSRKSRAASLSVASNTLLTAGKLAAGIVTGSVGIIAEALHSGIDLVAALIAYFSVRISDLPPDRDHPYGHGKAESIAGAIEALLIVVAAVWIVYEAIDKLVHGAAVEMLGLAAGVMAVSAAANLAVSRYLLKVAREEDSLALEADGQHLATDVYTSAGVACGMAAVWLSGWDWLDPLAALAVAVLIGVIGIKLVRNATQQLMDHGLPEAEQAAIRAILEAEPRVLSWHRLLTRKAGSQRYVIVHAVFPADISLREAHAVTDALECRIAEQFAPAHVTIHQEIDGEEACGDGQTSE
ncbi:MAG: cation transporter [Deltaproteobacteria bacterium]|nr:cation transporter [Deltaproteobacteria bacterium]